MIQIYLCDDEESVLHQIKTALEWKIFMENYDMEVACAVPGPSGRSGRRPPERLFPGRGFEGRGLGRLHPGTRAAAA